MHYDNMLPLHYDMLITLRALEYVEDNIIITELAYQRTQDAHNQTRF